MASKEKNTDFTSLRKIISEKRQSIAELEKEYENVKPSGNINPDNKLQIFNLEYLKLKAEIEVLTSTKPIVVPNCKSLRFAWAHHILKDDVRNLEEMVSFQKDMQSISLEKKTALEQLCEKEDVHCNLDEESFTYEELLEDEKFRSDILQCLHTKLIRRLRRITRQYFPAAETIGRKEKGNFFPAKKFKKRSMFSILQELLIELQDSSAKSDEWGKTRCIKLDESIPENYLNLLLKHRIVEFANKKCNSIKLVK